MLGYADPGVMPLHTPQLRGWPVEIVVLLVLDTELDHMVDIDVLVEVLELLLPDLPSLLIKEIVL
eukprot:11925795-Prorocentrum_lima.AAC.1